MAKDGNEGNNDISTLPKSEQRNDPAENLHHQESIIPL
jgi:hypothetical protein